MNPKRKWNEAKQKAKSLTKALGTMQAYDTLKLVYGHKIAAEAVWPGLGEYSLELHRLHNAIENRKKGNVLSRKRLRAMYQRHENFAMAKDILTPWFY